MLSGCGDIARGCFKAYFDFAYNPFPYSKDVSNDKSKWGGYEKDAVYELEHNVYLLEKGKDKKKYYTLSVPRELRECSGYIAIYSVPSFDEYKWNKDYYEKRGQHYMDIVGIVEKGTVLHCVKLIESGNLNVSGIDIYAEILEGKFKGYEVTLRSISCFNDCDMGPVIKYKPEPNLLTKVEE